MSNQTCFHIDQSSASFASFLRHCSQTSNHRTIKKIHAHLLRTGLLFISLNLHSALILSYQRSANQASPQSLTTFFKCIYPRDPFTYNVILSDFCRNGFANFALMAFSFMHSECVPIDTYALCSSLTASSFFRNDQYGKQIHAIVTKSGWLASVFVGSALIGMYAKSSIVNDAAVLFDEMPVKNTVCANALITCYSEAKMWTEGLRLVRKMPTLDLRYDHFTLSETLRACAGLSAIELGKQVHGYLIRMIRNVESDLFLLSTLIEMYGKCGMVGKAWKVFNLSGLGHVNVFNRDVILWTSMISVYGKNGFHVKVIELYNEMLMEGIRPDGVAFVTVISACGHTGQVTLGAEYFDSMVHDFGLDPGPEHYSCLVDLLCRAGELDKAWNFLNEMQSKGYCNQSVSSWGAFLSACIEHGKIDFGILAAHRALELDPKNAGIYVMLSNLYARFGMWNEIEHLRKLIKRTGLKKDVGCSWVEVTS